ncbi:hypothetical protein CDD83_11180 [Cordyceps sp. RAO-2017]|nr:hypothetical protein CDD83_11180 [Cordyceps sp. RAO-2017]
MAPPVKRVGRGRRDPRQDKDNDAHADVDLAFDNSSPGRPTKRRKRALSPDTTSTTVLDLDESPRTDNDQVVSQVSQQLKSQPAQAAKDHANAIHEANEDGVKAYAKVAAQDWTFYITKLSVNIGRAPEAYQTDGDDGDVNRQVHIDLGPSKMVSRDHASISFDPKDEKWLLQRSSH